ncbi:MAG TPA: efflux RND transporter periplasmic adaptor subunit [Pyrinomonadaceae bacterium]|jgi:HlyD family secretion protein
MALSRRKKIIIGVSALTLLVLIIGFSVMASRTDTPEVTTVKVETRRELKSTVTASGEVRPIQYINLTSEVQGRIVDIFVKEGDTVTKGQPLVKLDPTQLESSKDAQLAALQTAQSDIQVSQSQVAAAQNQMSQAQQGLNASQAAVDTALQAVASARQQVVAAQTDVDKAQVDLNAAQREFKRTSDLFESTYASRQEYDQAKDKVDTSAVALRNAKSRLESQKLAINEAEARVKEARARANQQAVAVRDGQRSVETANLNVRSSQSRANQQAAMLRGQTSQRDKTLQVAPINGVVAEIPSKAGTFATAGLSTTALMTIADMSSVNIEVKVDETEIDKVEVGQKAKIKIDAFNDREIEGEVSQKTPLALGKSQTTGGLSTNINVQEAKEFRVVVNLKNLPNDLHEGLRPGMSATATITTKTANDTVAVPLQAIVDKQPPTPTPNADGSQGQASQNQADKPKPIKGVYLLDEGKAKFVEVTTGITGESDIQITSGLSAGVEVITGPSRVLKTLKDGDPIKKQTKPAGGENANK